MRRSYLERDYAVGQAQAVAALAIYLFIHVLQCAYLLLRHSPDLRPSVLQLGLALGLAWLVWHGYRWVRWVVGIQMLLVAGVLLASAMRLGLSSAPGAALAVVSLVPITVLWLLNTRVARRFLSARKASATAATALPPIGHAAPLSSAGVGLPLDLENAVAQVARIVASDDASDDRIRSTLESIRTDRVTLRRELIALRMAAAHFGAWAVLEDSEPLLERVLNGLYAQVDETLIKHVRARSSDYAMVLGALASNDAFLRLPSEISARLTGNPAKNVGVVFAHHCGDEMNMILSLAGASVYAETLQQSKAVFVRLRAA